MWNLCGTVITDLVSLRKQGIV